MDLFPPSGDHLPGVSEISYIYDGRYHSRNKLKKLRDDRLNEFFTMEDVDRLYSVQDENEESLVICIRRKQRNEEFPHLYGKYTLTCNMEKNAIENTVVYTHNPNVLWYIFLGDYCYDQNLRKMLKTDGVVVDGYVNLQRDFKNHCQSRSLQTFIHF